MRVRVALAGTARGSGPVLQGAERRSAGAVRPAQRLQGGLRKRVAPQTAGVQGRGR